MSIGPSPPLKGEGTGSGLSAPLLTSPVEGELPSRWLGGAPRHWKNIAHALIWFTETLLPGGPSPGNHCVFVTFLTNSRPYIREAATYICLKFREYAEMDIAGD